MTFETIIGLTVQALSQRNANLDLDSLLTGINDLTGTVAAAFVNFGRLKLQRAHDFDCMKAPVTGQLYAAGGLALLPSIKRPYVVYHQSTSSTRQATRGAEIWPASEADAVRIALEHRGRHHHGGGHDGWRGREFPGGTSALDLDPGRLVWWMRGGRLILSRAGRPGDDAEFAGVPLWLDTYSYLDDYTLPEDSDWFSQWGSDVLVLMACIWSGMLGQRDERLATFKQELREPFAELVALNEQVMAGGQADGVLAPTRGYRTMR